MDFATLSTSPRSIGQVFKLPEAALRKTLECLEDRSNGIFIFDDSAAIPRVSLDDELPEPVRFLEHIYMLDQMSKIFDHISLSDRFNRSIRLEKDFFDPTALDAYVVTADARDQLNRILKA